LHKPESEVLVLRPRQKKGHKAREQQCHDGGYRFEKKHLLIYTPVFRAGASGQAHGRIEKHVDDVDYDEEHAEFE
jgi:hypothetical protein